MTAISGDRYARDPSRPTLPGAGADLARRTLPRSRSEW